MESQTVRAVERAIDILDAIRVLGGSAGVTEISERLGLSKSTVHRLLVALQRKEMVGRRTDSERYAIGHKALELALSATTHADLVGIAMPFLEEIRERMGETGALALKVGLRYTYVSQVVSSKEHHVRPVLGVQYPLHWGATGKIILATVKADELGECLRVVPHLRSTPRTVTDPNLLLSQLEQIRRDGYAVSFGERNMGAGAIAAPVVNRRGVAFASVCVMGPESRFRDMDLAVEGRSVAEVARRLQNLCQLLGLGD